MSLALRLAMNLGFGYLLPPAEIANILKPGHVGRDWSWLVTFNYRTIHAAVSSRVITPVKELLGETNLGHSFAGSVHFRGRRNSDWAGFLRVRTRAHCLNLLLLGATIALATRSQRRHRKERSQSSNRNRKSLIVSAWPNFSSPKTSSARALFRFWRARIFSSMLSLMSSR